ncbi:MAG TPA: PDZ domain-containing protein [Phycisphaerales bacterium]|nr:PDZ domain-containing protein [Phycisphaerales bacterium]
MKSFTMLSSSFLLAMAISASVAAQPARQGGVRQAPPPPPAPPAPMHVEHHTTSDGARVVASHIIIRTDKGEFEISREGDKVDVRPKGNVGAVNIEQTPRAVIISDENGLIAEVQIAPNGGLMMTSSRSAGALARERLLARAMERGFDGPSPRARLGIVLGQVDAALAAQLGVDPSEVILISSVAEGEAADKAGLKKHDIIVKVDGESPIVQSRLREIMLSKEPGDSIEIEVLRERQPLRVEVKLEPFAQQQLWRERFGDIAAGWGDLPAIEVDELMAELRAMRGAAGQADVFRREFMDRGSQLNAVVDKLRREAQVLREQLEAQIMKWRDAAMDENVQAELRQSLTQAIEHAARALERAASEMHRREVEVEFRAPRIEILREGGRGGAAGAPGARGMIVHPPSPPARDFLDDVPILAEMFRAQASGAAERRIGHLEERLARIERMLERLIEREGN